jgi:hypothetical protein
MNFALKLSAGLRSDQKKWGKYASSSYSIIYKLRPMVWILKYTNMEFDRNKLNSFEIIRTKL